VELISLCADNPALLVYKLERRGCETYGSVVDTGWLGKTICLCLLAVVVWHVVCFREAKAHAEEKVEQYEILETWHSHLVLPL
jgi:hypothetical protein